MQQPARTRFAVITFSLIAVLLGVAFLLLHLTGPSDGARLAPGEPDWRPDGVIVTPIKEQSSGLQQGDVVVAVEGSSIEFMDSGASRAWSCASPMACRPDDHLHCGAQWTSSGCACDPGTLPIGSNLDTRMEYSALRTCLSLRGRLRLSPAS